VWPLLCDLSPDTDPEAIAAVASAGVHLYRLRANAPELQDDGTLTYAPLWPTLEALRKADPQAWFLLEVSVDPPEEWLRKYPEARVRYCLPGNGEGESGPVSWASQRWKQEMGEALTRLLRSLSGRPSGERCFGVQVAAGLRGEWITPEPERLPDIGPQMAGFFRSFALEKYRRNAGLLRRAWFDTRADFQKIRCPDAFTRRRAEIGCFRSPHRSRYLLDYYECLAEAQNAAALHFCRVAHRATGGQILVGLAYASPVPKGGRPEGAHCLPAAVLDAPEIDFFVACDRREAGFPNALTGSLALRGKLLFCPVAADRPPREAAALAGARQHGLMLPASTPRADLSAIAQAGERTLRAPAPPRKRVGPFAVCVDPGASMYVAEQHEAQERMDREMLRSTLRHCASLGVAYEVYTPADLFHPQFPEHPVTLFVNSFYLSEAERRRLDARIKRSGQTALWMWAPGVVGEEGIDAEQGRSCCGQKLRLEGNASLFATRIVEPNDLLTRGFHAHEGFGDGKPLAPTLTVSDKNSVRLGANTDNKTIFAVRRFDTWTSVVYGSAPVPLRLLRNALRAAACHLYVENLPSNVLLCAGARSLALIGKAGESFQVSLPGVFDVTDAWTGARVAAAVNEFTATLPDGGVGWYELRLRPPVK